MDGLVQVGSISNASAMEILRSFTKLSNEFWSYVLLYSPSSLYQYPCTAQIHNTIAMCSSKVKCWWIVGLWDVASRARPLTTLLHIIPHKRFLTRMIGSAGSVEIATIGTGYISLAGFTWLVVTIGNASTVWYTWASGMNCCWGAGGWWVRRGSCCWWCGWWTSRALVFTAFLHIIPHKRFLTGMSGSAGSVEIATIGTGYISLAGFTWLVVTIENASTVWYTWASRMNCCWGAGGTSVAGLLLLMVWLMDKSCSRIHSVSSHHPTQEVSHRDEWERRVGQNSDHWNRIHIPHRFYMIGSHHRECLYILIHMGQ